jgi:hypothetical protein
MFKSAGALQLFAAAQDHNVQDFSDRLVDQPNHVLDLFLLGVMFGP